MAANDMNHKKLGAFIQEMLVAAQKAGVSITGASLTIYDDTNEQLIGPLSYRNPSPQCGSGNPKYKDIGQLVRGTTPCPTGIANSEGVIERLNGLAQDASSLEAIAPLLRNRDSLLRSSLGRWSFFSLANVKVIASPLARASVDSKVEVITA